MFSENLLDLDVTSDSAVSRTWPDGLWSANGDPLQQVTSFQRCSLFEGGGDKVDWQTICWGISACRPPCPRNTIYFPFKASSKIQHCSFKTWQLVQRGFQAFRAGVHCPSLYRPIYLFGVNEISLRTLSVNVCNRYIICTLLVSNLLSHVGWSVSILSEQDGDYNWWQWRKLLPTSVLRLRFQLSQLICPPVPAAHSPVILPLLHFSFSHH